MDAGAIVVYAGGFSALLAAAGVAGAAFRSARTGQVVTELQRLADTRKEKAADLDRAIADLQAEGAAKDLKITELQGKVAVLQDMVTGKAAVEQLAAGFGQMVAHMDERVSEALKQAGAIRGEVRDVHEAVEAVAAALARRDGGRQ